MQQRITALLERYRSDAAFRDAVDDMTAAVGLLLPNQPLGGDIDNIVLLARFKREQARRPRTNSSSFPAQHVSAAPAR